MSTPSDHDAAKKHLTWFKGWSDAVGSRPMRNVFMGYSDPRLVLAYESGYVQGQRDRRAASEKATKLYGYKPNIIRTV